MNDQILINKSWLEGLLRQAELFENKINQNDKAIFPMSNILLESAALRGYISSAKTILQYGKATKD